MSAQLRQDLAARLFPELQRLFSPIPKLAPSPAALVSLLADHPHAAAWGENPLLFSLAAVVFVKTGDLPPSRATLYRDVIEAMLTMREPDTVSRNHLLRTLTGFALWLHQTRERTFTSGDLLTFLEDIQQRPWQDAEYIAKRIITSGILDVVARDTYGFRHQTFQEFLAAAELAKRLTSQDAVTREEAWNFALSKRTYSRWTEVLRLMVGVLAQLPGKKGRAEAGRWIQQLVSQRSTEEGDPGDLGLELALKSLVEVTEMTEWETVRTAQLEEQVASAWLHELLDAAQNQRTTRKERFKLLAKDVAYLRRYRMSGIVEGLVKALKDPDEVVQQDAGEMLEALGARVPLEVLLTMLQDKDEDVRLAAVQVAGQQGERVPIEPLLAMLQDPNPYVRQAAVQAAGRQGERVPIEPLLAMLQDPNPYVRQAAVQAAGRQGERVPIELLLAMLQDKDEDVRQAAVKAAGQQGERVPIEPLLTMLQDKDRNVRQMAAEALIKQSRRVSIDALLFFLSDKDAVIRQNAIQVLGTQHERIPLEPLMGLIGDEDGDVRDAALQVVQKVVPHLLDELAPQALSVLQGKLVGNIFISLHLMFVADTISDLGLAASDLLEQLTELLDHPWWQVRLKAIQALGRLHRNIPDAAIQRLLVFRRDPDPRMQAVREAADDALAEILSLEGGIEAE